MTGTTSQVDRAVQAFQATIDALKAEKIEPIFLFVAIAEILGRLAKEQENGAQLIDSTMQIMRAYAETIRTGQAFGKAINLVDDTQQR